MIILAQKSLRRRKFFTDRETKILIGIGMNAKEEKILSDLKIKLKVMGQVVRLEKEMATLEKKLEIKKDKMSELINTLDNEKSSSKKRSMKSTEENGKTDDSSVLFAQD